MLGRMEVIINPKSLRTYRALGYGFPILSACRSSESVTRSGPRRPRFFLSLVQTKKFNLMLLFLARAAGPLVSFCLEQSPSRPLGTCLLIAGQIVLCGVYDVEQV
jgi:hypothetical protein